MRQASRHASEDCVWHYAEEFKKHFNCENRLYFVVVERLTAINKNERLKAKWKSLTKRVSNESKERDMKNQENEWTEGRRDG